MPEPNVAVVTGPTSGIGRWIALGLARTGMRVVLLARDAARARETRRWIADQVAGAQTEIVHADLSLMAQTAEAAATIARLHPQLHLLVNNAGMYSLRRGVTNEGHERTLAVNHLAPFLLTRGLLESLRAAAPARVVNVGSVASDRAALALDDLQSARGYSGWRAYGQSKLALMMATFEWAARVPAEEVTFNVVHPGLVGTNIARGGIAGFAWRLATPFMLRPARGADPPLWVALATELAGISGRYFRKRGEARPNPLALDAVLRGRLWEETELLAQGCTSSSTS